MPLVTNDYSAKRGKEHEQAACIASILACMAFYCVMHALVCPARFSPVYGCFCGVVRPVLAWRSMEFCVLFRVPGFLYSGRNCRARYAVKIGLYGLLWPCMCIYTFIGVLRFLWRFFGRMACVGIRHTVSILRGSCFARIAAGAVDKNHYVTHAWEALCKWTFPACIMSFYSFFVDFSALEPGIFRKIFSDRFWIWQGDATRGSRKRSAF